MSCGHLKQSKLTVVSCTAVGKLHHSCHSFCTLGLRQASHFCDWQAWGSFVPAVVGSCALMALCSQLSYLMIFGVLGILQWTDFWKRDDNSSGTCWQVWLASRMEQNRYLVWCFCGTHYLNQGSVLCEACAKFLYIMGMFSRESAGNCWGIFALQSFFGVYHS